MKKLNRKTYLATIGDFTDDENIYVDAHKLVKHHICIKTTNKEVKQYLIRFKSMCKKEITNISNNAFRAIMAINIDKLYENKKKFNEFCTDIIIIYVLRHILYGSLLPIIPFKSMSKDMQDQLNAC